MNLPKNIILKRDFIHFIKLIEKSKKRYNAKKYVINIANWSLKGFLYLAKKKKVISLDSSSNLQLEKFLYGRTSSVFESLHIFFLIGFITLLGFNFFVSQFSIGTSSQTRSRGLRDFVERSDLFTGWQTRSKNKSWSWK